MDSTASSDDLTQALRLTGRISFLLFLVLLVARPLHQFVGTGLTAWLLSHRGNFGLAFAGNRAIHLALVALLVSTPSGLPITTLETVGGAFGMFYLAIMVALTIERPARWVGPRVTSLAHRLILYYLVFVFAYDFMLKDPFGTYPVLAAIWFAAVGLRLAAWGRGRLGVVRYAVRCTIRVAEGGRSR